MNEAAEPHTTDSATPAGNHDGRAGPRLRRSVLAGVLASILLAGIGGVAIRVLHPDADHQDRPSMFVAPGGEIDLGTVPDDVARRYRLARSQPALFAQIPCYCGCQSFLAHRGLYDCFVRPQGGWERHAAGCGVCLGEARTVADLLDQGADPGLIRRSVIDDFGQGQLPPPAPANTAA